MEEKYIFLLVAIFLYILIVFLFSRLGRKKEIGTVRLFWLSVFLTPLMGLAFLLSSQERKMNPYTEQNFKCDHCGYIFSENYHHCPFCEKEGHQYELTPVSKFMT